MKKQIIIILLVSACFVFSTQQIQEQSVVINVEIPTRVFDGNTFVDNLSIDDFEIYEDGRPQKLDAIYLIKRKSIERREEIKRFPLRGIIAILLGCVLSYFLFVSEQSLFCQYGNYECKLIVISGIIVLLAGDAAACLYGIYFGRVRNPLAPKKRLDATLVGIIVSAIFIFLVFKCGGLASFSFWRGFWAATVALLFESFEFNKKFVILDDNIFIPLIAGFVLSFL